ncbi:hypothetical protein OAB57_01090 [Bacteriovoracaceae bacterium]|nr:hypothetical protein [Bacteriovoracaceae bacterium]
MSIIFILFLYLCNTFGADDRATASFSKSYHEQCQNIKKNIFEANPKLPTVKKKYIDSILKEFLIYVNSLDTVVKSAMSECTNNSVDLELVDKIEPTIIKYVEVKMLKFAIEKIEATRKTSLTTQMKNDSGQISTLLNVVFAIPDIVLSKKNMKRYFTKMESLFSKVKPSIDEYLIKTYGEDIVAHFSRNLDVFTKIEFVLTLLTSFEFPEVFKMVKSSRNVLALLAEDMRSTSKHKKSSKKKKKKKEEPAFNQLKFVHVIDPISEDEDEVELISYLMPHLELPKSISSNQTRKKTPIFSFYNIVGKNGPDLKISLHRRIARWVDVSDKEVRNFTDKGVKTYANAGPLELNFAKATHSLGPAIGKLMAYKSFRDKHMVDEASQSFRIENVSLKLFTTDYLGDISISTNLLQDGLEIFHIHFDVRKDHLNSPIITHSPVFLSKKDLTDETSEVLSPYLYPQESSSYLIERKDDENISIKILRRKLAPHKGKVEFCQFVF